MISFGVGESILAPIVYYMRDWREIYLFVFVPYSILMFFALLFFMIESPRYFVGK